MNYTIDDLKEGRIIVFDNGTEYYGIISKDIPNNENIKLACVYEKGGWEKLETVLEYKFSLYESKYPMYSFMNLIESRDINFCKRCKCLKEVQKPVSFIQAIKSERKIRVEHEYISNIIKADEVNFVLEDYMSLVSLMDILCDNLVTSELSEVILNGKWYIDNAKN